MGSKTTYYSLAKDKLKGKHPRIYNLILIFALLSLTGTAAFLISDILSFGIDCDNDTVQEKGPTLSVLGANSSPSEEIISQSTANSTEKDELGNASREQNSSQDRSIAMQAAGSSVSAKRAGTSTSISKSHSSSDSSSSSRSISSSEKMAEEMAAVPNNESENLTAIDQTSTAQLPGNSSATLSVSNDTASTKQQSNRLPVGIYRNESPQIAVGQKGRADSQSKSESLMIATGVAGMTASLNSLADNERSTVAANVSKTEMPAKGETPNKAGTSPKPETVVKTESPDNAVTQIKAEETIKVETPAEDRIPGSSAGVEGSTSARANERQESRSKQTIDLAREKAEHSEAMAIERSRSSSSMVKVRMEKSESARERRECNDVAMSAKAIAVPSISGNGKRSPLPAASAQDSKKDEKNDAALGPASAVSPPTAQKGKDSASLSRASASTSRFQAHEELKSSRSEQSEKIADLRSDRTDASAASKASAATLRARDLSERMKAKEEAREMTISAANARKSRLQESKLQESKLQESKLQESRSRPAVK